jgi:hypothetical protein
MKVLLSLLIVFTLILVFSGCLFLGDGSDTFIKESSNNNHSKKAVLFLREAGATVADSYQVSITDYTGEFDSTAVGNAFIVDGAHGKANLTQKAINFNWLSKDTIEIGYDKNLRTFLQEKNINGVTIIYKAK